MKKNKISLAACISAALLAPTAQAGLFDDATTTLRYANYPWTGDTKDSASGIPTYKEGEWVHALEVKYHSGYFNDVIGFDYGIYGVDTISTKSDATRTQNIDGVNDEGHGGTNLAYLKSKFQLGDWDLRAGYGKKRRAFETYEDFNYRIVEATTVGADISLSRDDLSLYATVIDKASRRNQDNFGGDLKTFLGETIDNISVFGLKYQPSKAWTFKAEHLEAKDYIKRDFLGVNYNYPLNDTQSLNLDGRFGTMKDAGDLFERVPLGQYANDPDGLDASFNELALTFKDKELGYYATLWRTDVNGDDFNRILFTEDHGWWASRTQLWQWSGLEGETSYGVKAGIDFSKHNIPGLSLHATAVRSNSAEGYDDFSRQEFRTVAMYKFQQPVLKGLSVVWLHIDHEAEGTPDGIRRTGTGAGPTALAQGDADRIYINYVKKF
ncbi:OprD family outer membrane porin [Neptuniibacter halophilus]|uniref:OprD family outer membrane porin n=1 Tax=Neptuniibacter halophilus TaxID=651666 RepID=UPI0025744550|nr:OprD family outer membrane porin [Neptuniibacter halophilus]